MDDRSRGGEELREALRHLRRLNRMLGAAGPALYGVKRLWRQAGRPDRLTVLDVGSGGGDLNRRILRWADRRRVAIKILLADVTAEAQAEAEALYRNEPRVEFVMRDIFHLGSVRADIVTASQLIHHLSPEQVPQAVERMLSVASVGVVVNDIHRHWLPWAAVWLVTRLISRNSYIRHDGPLSVAKGFRRADFRALAGRLHGASLICRWRPLFRYAVIVTKQDGAAGRVRPV